MYGGEGVTWRNRMQKGHTSRGEEWRLAGYRKVHHSDTGYAPGLQDKRSSTALKSNDVGLCQ